jgi:hypothetical protein
MSYNLRIKYKKKSDFNRNHLTHIIDNLNPIDKVSAEVMGEPLFKGKSYTLTFGKEEFANQIAEFIFKTYGNYFDIHKEYI